MVLNGDHIKVKQDMTRLLRDAKEIVSDIERHIKER